jgi:prevent-host-death family protein
MEVVMKKTKWQLQEAKNRFSEVVRKASNEGPQFVTKHGKESVVVLSVTDYNQQIERKESLFNFLEKSPLKESELNVERDKSAGREVNL